MYAVAVWKAPINVQRFYLSYCLKLYERKKYTPPYSVMDVVLGIIYLKTGNVTKTAFNVFAGLDVVHSYVDICMYNCMMPCTHMYVWSA